VKDGNSGVGFGFGVELLLDEKKTTAIPIKVKGIKSQIFFISYI